ncbi:hypothetical protein PC116_g4955 [Phytophthora cactorum]|uniref:Uncharacterized protein n=1 Tax=Phytophthora cactorum TaxID=29920 RepID=A0A8T1LD88_9STRA|nr:hypothetical protein PC114_g4579 [Phytophthora cactorum]KAG2950648.1 hypothetical protein PC117_g4235 [Phytophthora cactorum]KAG3036947.1 hypothetical protein PC119_g3997 [Phytophthora cactorum]KAG3186169.1 hypothetical protein C6341_g3974 [Phytophthora cactorum]KAG3199629.1 hypothetical protein PC128_g5199 [Phytophthora cactorum]
MGLTSMMSPWRTGKSRPQQPTPSRPQSHTIRSQSRGDTVKKIRALQVRGARATKKKRRHNAGDAFFSASCCYRTRSVDAKCIRDCFQVWCDFATEPDPAVRVQRHQ